MKMRSQHVPEDTRSTIINFFRIPLNLFVCVVLYNVRTRDAVSCSHYICACSFGCTDASSDHGPVEVLRSRVLHTTKMFALAYELMEKQMVW